MKTQIIIRRSLLVAIALFIYINVNNGSIKMLPANNYVSTYPARAISEQSSNNTKATQHKTEDPYLPQIEHEYDIDLCDFKHHEKRIFWKCVANRAFAILYHIIILMPILGESFAKIIAMIEHKF